MSMYGPMVTDMYLSPSPTQTQAPELPNTSGYVYPPSRSRPHSPSHLEARRGSQHSSRSPSPAPTAGSRRTSSAAQFANLHIQIPQAGDNQMVSGEPQTITLQVPAGTQIPMPGAQMPGMLGKFPAHLQSSPIMPTMNFSPYPDEIPRNAESFSMQSQESLQLGHSPVIAAQPHQGTFEYDMFSPLAPTEVAVDVKAIHDALMGVDGQGVDARTLIALLGTLTPSQCAQLSKRYKATYGTAVTDDVQKQLSGNFAKLAVGLVTPLPAFDAHWCKDALSGLGTNEDVLFETLVGRSNDEINAIKTAFHDLYGKKLEDAVASETSGNVKKLLIAVLQAQRDESPNYYDIEGDVETLFQETRKKHRWSRDPTVFISILCGRSNTHLLAVFESYMLKHGQSIEGLIKKECSGDLEKGLMTLVRSIENRPAHVATLFEASLHGFLGGIQDNTLIRLTVRHRDPRVMTLVRDAYQSVFGESLYRRVEDKTVGDYKRLLLRCIGLDVAE
ncbi:hypothetical protein DFJ77DRAFT_474872 [Powellomyces hirtus]|nr:hypothetical protein DFJ77DRAFT_474872 [Powellomyces hirtus]